MKFPVKLAFKIVGALCLGTASVLQAMDTDEKVQEVIKKVVEKIH
jgi:hypothetical protein